MYMWCVCQTEKMRSVLALGESGGLWMLPSHAEEHQNSCLLHAEDVHLEER